jgi:hypothetical protein
MKNILKSNRYHTLKHLVGVWGNFVKTIKLESVGSLLVGHFAY